MVATIFGSQVGRRKNVSRKLRNCRKLATGGFEAEVQLNKVWCKVHKPYYKHKWTLVA